MSIIIPGKMLKSIKVSVVLITSLLLTGCPENADKSEIAAIVKVNNSSNKKVIYLHWYSSWQNNDTLLSSSEIEWDHNKYSIEPSSFANMLVYNYNKIAIDSGDILMVYFFDPDTLAQVPWERIARENIVLKRVDIHSWKELEDRNFEISFP